MLAVLSVIVAFQINVVAAIAPGTAENIHSTSYVYALTSLPEISESPKPTFFQSPKFTYCSCVEFAKWLVGKQGNVWGNARDMKPDSNTPQVGGLVLTYEGSGHVGVVKEIATDSFTFEEANYRRCQRQTRTLKINDKKIKGFKISF